MTSLTPGANVALSSVRLTVTLGLGDTTEPAALLLTEHGKARSAYDFLSAHNPSGPGVSWAASPDGSGWQLSVNLDEVPPEVATVRVVGSLPENGGTYGQLEAPSARVEDASGTAQATFEMSRLGVETSLIVLELYRRQDAWKVRALGQGYAGGRPAMLADHGIDPASVPAAASARITPPAAQPSPSASGAPTVRYERPDRVIPPAAPAAPAAGNQTGQPIRYERPGRAATRPAPSAEPQRAAQSAPQPPAASPARPRPVPTGPLPLWDLVEQRPSDEHPVRPVSWETRGAEFTVCERVRDLLPDSDTLPPGVDKFTVAEQWSQQLRAMRGSGFEYTWRDPHDQPLNPTWITLRSAHVDQTTGRIVAAGHLTHENFDTSPAYDLGALNGSNGLSWPDKGHTEGLVYPTDCLYIGSTRTGSLVPVDSSSNLSSVDYDPATGTIAVMESLGSSGCISVYDGTTGARRRLTVIEQISGNEQLRFSLDGKWLLMPRYDGSHLCEVSTGRTVRLPVKQCCWWPLADSTLLEVDEVDGRRVPKLFSLETNAFIHEFPTVAFDTETSPGVEYVAQPSVSPGGTELLVLTPVGVGPDHREEYGVSGHLARVTLADGRGQLVNPATLNASIPTERDVSEARWTGPYPYREVRLAPALTQQLQPPVLDHPYLAPGRYSPEAEEVLVRALNRAIALFQQGEDIAHLMPEVVMSMITVREDIATWEQQSEWLLGLGSTVTDMISDGRMTGRNVGAWRHFANEVISISTTGESRVGPARAAWI